MTTAATRAPGACSPPGSFDPERARADFPALAQLMHGRPLVYLDNAATTQKPRAVIDALRHYYEADNANIHRGVHALSVRATQAHERARAAVQSFIGAARPEDRYQGSVLMESGREVGTRGIVPHRRISGPEGRIRPPHHDATELSPHGLTTIDLHRPLPRAMRRNAKANRPGWATSRVPVFSSRAVD